MVDFHKLWESGQAEADRLIRQFADPQHQYIERDPFDPETQELVALTVHQYRDGFGRTTYLENPPSFTKWAGEIQDAGNSKGQKMFFAGLAMPKPGYPIVPPVQIPNGEPAIPAGPALLRLALIAPLAGSLQEFNSELNPLQPKLTSDEITIYVVQPKNDPKTGWQEWLNRMGKLFGEEAVAPFMPLSPVPSEDKGLPDQTTVVSDGETPPADPKPAEPSATRPDEETEPYEAGEAPEPAEIDKKIRALWPFGKLPEDEDFPAVIRLLEIKRSLAPGPWADNKLAILYRALGYRAWNEARLDEAEQLFRKAHELNPVDNTLAKFLRKNGRPEEALQTALAALKHNPPSHRSHMLLIELAEIYIQLNNVERAILIVSKTYDWLHSGDGKTHPYRAKVAKNLAHLYKEFYRRTGEPKYGETANYLFALSSNRPL